MSSLEDDKALEVTNVACCVICDDPRSELVEILDFSLILCGYCIDGLKPLAVVVYDNKVPIKMAVDLGSEYAAWRVRLRDMTSFAEAEQVLYQVIDDLIGVKLSLI